MAKRPLTSCLVLLAGLAGLVGSARGETLHYKVVDLVSGAVIPGVRLSAARTALLPGIGHPMELALPDLPGVTDAAGEVKLTLFLGSVPGGGFGEELAKEGWVRCNPCRERDASVAGVRMRYLAPQAAAPALEIDWQLRAALRAQSAGTGTAMQEAIARAMQEALRTYRVAGARAQAAEGRAKETAAIRQFCPLLPAIEGYQSAYRDIQETERELKAVCAG